MVSLSFIFFFSLGFGKALLYLPFAALYFICAFRVREHVKISIAKMIGFLLSILILTSVFGIGYEHIQSNNPIRLFFSILIPLLLGGIAFLKANKKNQVLMISGYVFGVVLDVFLVVVNSMFYEGYAGYAKLIEPYSGTSVNSPGYGSLLAVGSAFFIYAIKESGGYKKVLYLAALIFSLVCGAFIVSRTFFLVVFLAFLYVGFEELKRIKPLKVFLVFVGLVSILFFYSKSFELFGPIAQRFEDGLASNRFYHFKVGFQQLPYYPFGGFSVSNEKETTYWFHNFFLDAARNGGWLPIFFISSLIILAFLSFLISKKDVIMRRMFFLYFFIFLVMQQDVVLEGQFRLFLMFAFISLFLINSKRYFVEDDKAWRRFEYVSAR